MGLVAVGHRVGEKVLVLLSVQAGSPTSHHRPDAVGSDREAGDPEWPRGEAGPVVTGRASRATDLSLRDLLRGPQRLDDSFRFDHGTREAPGTIEHLDRLLPPRTGTIVRSDAR